MTDIYVNADASAPNDGTSEGDGWLTLQAAFTDITGKGAGPHTIYWKKAAADYDELATIATAGAAGAEVQVVGYETTITDNVQVTIDGGGLLRGITSTPSGPLYYAFRNIIITASSGSGFDLVTEDNCSFINCESHTNGISGFICNDRHAFLQCEAYSNSEDGFNLDDEVSVHSCKSYANTDDQFTMSGAACIINTLIYGIEGAGDIGIRLGGLNLYTVANCTIDGEGSSATNFGIGLSTSNNVMGMFVNNIIYDCGTGVNFTTDGGRLATVGYNLMNTFGTADYTNVTEIPGSDQTGAPDFELEGSDDYRVKNTSPAVNNASDAGT